MDIDLLGTNVINIRVCTVLKMLWRCLALNIHPPAIMDAPEILVHCECCGRFHCKMRIITRRVNILDVGIRSCIVLEIVFMFYITLPGRHSYFGIIIQRTQF
jgi:hypothetical protein